MNEDKEDIARISLYLPESLAKSCRSYAKTQNRSLANFLLCIISSAIASIGVESDHKGGQEE